LSKVDKLLIFETISQTKLVLTLTLSRRARGNIS
jgi:hypothetical protein